MNGFPTTTPYSNGPYPVGQVSDVIYGNDTTSFLYQQQGSHYGHQQEDVFYHQSQPNWDAYHPNNTYHNSDSNYHQRSHASRGRDCPYPVSPSTSIQAPAAYSRHPGGGVAPLVDARNAHIPPLYTINAHSTTSNTSHTYSTGHGAGYETSNPHGHSHKHGDQVCTGSSNVYSYLAGI
ncbi:hypothetical protein E1B28_011137 [Marasmius oreades]|uniref:Uncharacterized protein n=1 Tax=Marasmius oreades TaxID=181124 RepID=A0A9P7RTZ3_9AGAR|nr:uncharacterized protein E1B28_011137 [Marasmius oreades]KAG7089452.1 hypothetical protein E1B28_011137 [Marasmius oreades]